MAKQKILTDNLADILPDHLNEVCDILNAWRDSGLPVDFSSREVKLQRNTQSGFIFLTNEYCDVAMLNESTGELESWYYTPYEGHEGFFDDLLEDYSIMHRKDKEFMRQIAANIDREEDLPQEEKEEEEE